jgi:leucyl aminopeptidase
MNIQVRKADPLKQKSSCLVVGVFEKKFSDPLLKALDQALDGLLRQAQRSGEFTGKSGEKLLLQPAGALAAERLLLIGLGTPDQASTETLRRAAGEAFNALKGKRLKNVACSLPTAAVRNTDLAERTAAVTEGLLLAAYRFNRYQSANGKQKPQTPQSVTLLIEQPAQRAAAEQAVARAESLCRGVVLARDLVNEPGNIKSPLFLAEQAQSAAADSKLRCTIMNQATLEREGFGAMLGVAQGSIREPQLILLEHQGGQPDQAPVALVGKGVVFDAGGISLKPAEKMDEMKMDMAGGAAVIGTMLAASLLELPINLVGVVPAVENMPSGSAIRPGDILTSLSGQTIEVLNTDAEGRLILADALTFVKRFEPRLVIDLATLTGACIIALGHHASAVLGNDQKLVQSLLQAGETSGERLWQLPLWDDYDQLIKSDVADVKNIGGRAAGTITAAAFLKKFAKDFKWAHLDIAGTAWLDQARPYSTKGASGVGVRLLIEFLKGLDKG